MELEIVTLIKDYGVLGLWTASLLYERFKQQSGLKKTIENNTVALTKVYECMGKLKK